AQQLSPRTRQSLPHARGNAFALFRAADRLGICVQEDVQMNPVKNKAERSHALPRELWPILALIFTGPVLFVNVLLGGDRALQRAWIIALIGLACFGFLGRRNKTTAAERWTDRCLSPALLTPRPSGDHLPGSQIRRQPRGSASKGLTPHFVQHDQ